MKMTSAFSVKLMVFVGLMSLYSIEDMQAQRERARAESFGSVRQGSSYQRSAGRFGSSQPSGGAMSRQPAQLSRPGGMSGSSRSQTSRPQRDFSSQQGRAAAFTSSSRSSHGQYGSERQGGGYTQFAQRGERDAAGRGVAAASFQRSQPEAQVSRGSVQRSTEQISLNCSGQVSLYGRGTFEVNLSSNGSFRIDDRSQVSFQRESRSMTKTRSGDAWSYQSVNSPFSLSGNDITLEISGSVRELKGNGSGTIILLGTGSYRTSTQSGTIPNSGITIDFGSVGVTSQSIEGGRGVRRR